MCQHSRSAAHGSKTAPPTVAVSPTAFHPVARSPILDAIADRHVIRAGVAPAATVAAASGSTASWTIVVGAAGFLDLGRTDPTDPLTPFDLASVTKPFVATTVARLAAAGALALETPVSDLLPELRGVATGAATLELLLAHRAGLAPHLELFRPLVAWRATRLDEAVRCAARARQEDCAGPPPASGCPPTYSDLGYFLVGQAIERCLSRPLDEVVAEQVTGPLGLSAASARQWSRAGRGFRARVAPTEHVPWRGGTLRGVVHDDNAWALGGHGLCGHAGLFGTADDIARFGAELLDALAGRSGWLDPPWIRRLVAPRPGGSLRAGFDSRSPGGSAAGDRAGADTFGHLGFTGTSFWCDPAARAVTVLLANRVCPSRENPRIRAARPLVHDALFAHAAGGLEGPPAR